MRTLTAARTHRRLALAAMALLLACTLGLPARLAGAETATSGSMTLSVSKATNLSPDGEIVTVSGSGYDVEKGIYVAFCVLPPAGSVPTPCGGGVDLSGTSGASAWISSNPPSYGQGLATPYGEGGTFTVNLAIGPMINDSTDCRVVACAVVTRADHTRTSDRSMDVFVPVTFAAPATPEPTTDPATTAPGEPTDAPTDAPTATPTTTPTATPTAIPPTATPSPTPVAPAVISEDGRTATRDGRTLTVSAAKELDPSGATAITVEGSGFDESQGIYVALCAVPAAGKAPSPCQSGSPEVAAWISSNPPSYGVGIAKPYESGGAFKVSLKTKAQIDSSTDCAKVACGIYVRSDDTQAANRSQDIGVPVSFAAAAPAATPAPTKTVAAAIAPTNAAEPTTAASQLDDSSDGGSGDGSSMALWLTIAGVMVILIAAGALSVRRFRGKTAGGTMSILAVLVLLGISCGGDDDDTPGVTAAASEAVTATATAPAAVNPLTDTGIIKVQSTAPPQLPITVMSDDGREVTITDISRIVPLWGNITEVVYGLGLGDNVVGRDVTATFPEAEHLPLVTRAHDTSAEGVISLRPTLVLASMDNTGPSSAIDHIRNVGIPVVWFKDPTSVDEVLPRIQSIADALGVSERGEELVSLTAARMEGARDGIPAGVRPPKVAFLYMRGQAGVYLISGPKSGADSMIVAAGGIDAGTEMGLDRPFTPLTSEALAQAAPDVILMTTTGLQSVGGIEGLLKIPGIAQTPAGKNRAIVTEDDLLLYSFGPRTPAALRLLIESIYSVYPSGEAKN